MPTTWSIRASLGASPALKRSGFKIVATQNSSAIGWARLASAGRSAQEPREDMSIARLLAFAFPERIGKARGAPGQFLLANGRGANVDSTHPLAARSPFLVAAELSGSAASTRVLLAAAADEADIFAAASHRICENDEIEFDQSAGALRSRRVRRLDAILLTNEPRAVMASEETARLLADGTSASPAPTRGETACSAGRNSGKQTSGVCLLDPGASTTWFARI